MPRNVLPTFSYSNLKWRFKLMSSIHLHFFLQSDGGRDQCSVFCLEYPVSWVQLLKEAVFCSICVFGTFTKKITWLWTSWYFSGSFLLFHCSVCSFGAHIVLFWLLWLYSKRLGHMLLILTSLNLLKIIFPLCDPLYFHMSFKSHIIFKNAIC